MFSASRRLRPWIATFLLATLVLGWVSASAQVCLMERADADPRELASRPHCDRPHPCCEQPPSAKYGGVHLGCPGMETLTSPLLDIASGLPEPWDRLPPACLAALSAPIPVPATAPAVPEAMPLASTPRTHPSLRFRVLRI